MKEKHDIVALIFLGPRFPWLIHTVYVFLQTK